MSKSLSISIIGLPNVGKSTLFQTLTKKQVDCSNYPFATIDPNVGVVAVSDERVDKLAELEKSAKKIYATVEFFDIAGLVKGAASGEGLGNKFLANIRETDAILYILRAFADPNIINTQTSVDPLRDKDILDTELILKDLETISKRADNLEKEARAGKKEAQKELPTVSKAKLYLEDGKILAEQDFSDDEKAVLRGYQFLTMKPRLYLLNGKDESFGTAQDKGASREIIEIFKKNNWPFLIVDIMTELEAASFNSEERESLGLRIESELDLLIQKSYELLGLITFLTTGPDETRAWTIKKGATAPQAGGVIHTDFETNFIKAEVIGWQELLDCDGYAKAREKGLLRTEGKEYIVKDGDVVEIKHSA